MPGVVMNQDTSLGSFTSTTHNRWIDQQQYLVETYRQIRTNLGQLEAEIEAARLRVTNWDRLRRQPSRSRSLSHTSVSTNDGSVLSCSTDASFLNITTDGTTTGSSCYSSCSSACGMKLPSSVVANLSSATLISAFLAGSYHLRQLENDKSQMEQQESNQSARLLSSDQGANLTSRSTTSSNSSNAC